MSREQCPVHLVLIETSGNQRYIFATNKLREQVGASELIYRAGTKWVLEAVHKCGGPNLVASGPAQLREKLLDETDNAPIEKGAVIEVILAASGKALVLVRDRELGKRIVKQVTETALREAPGLDIRGVVSEQFDLASDSIHVEIKKVHEMHTAVRPRLPGPESRLQRLPIVAECRTSGGPAARLTGPDDCRLPQDEWGLPISHASLAKTKARQGWESRLGQIVRDKLKLARNLDDFEKQTWITVIHADGNGLGQVFLSFDKAIPDNPDKLAWNREYINTLRWFSLRLDERSQKAFLDTCCEARSWLPKEARDIVPVIPLIMGGDDLTVICAGAIGLRFAATYARRFEARAKESDNGGPSLDEVVRAVQAKLPGQNASGLTCSVGVAVVKPHFPFHAAYDLAEELLRSAKQLKPRPAIDFQIVYDSSAATLEQARKAWRVDGGNTELTARPYPLSRCEGDISWEYLEQLVGDLQSLSRSDAERSLPRSQLHSLREALFEGKDVACAQLQLIRHRYPEIKRILWQEKELFFPARVNGNSGTGSAGTQRCRTHLLDLLEVEGLQREGSRRRP